MILFSENAIGEYFMKDSEFIASKQLQWHFRKSKSGFQTNEPRHEKTYLRGARPG